MPLPSVPSKPYREEEKALELEIRRNRGKRRREHGCYIHSAQRESNSEVGRLLARTDDAAAAVLQGHK